MTSDATIITAISLGVSVLFMLGVAVFLVIGYRIADTTFVPGQTLDNVGAELANVFTRVSPCWRCRCSS